MKPEPQAVLSPQLSNDRPSCARRFWGIVRTNSCSCLRSHIVFLLSVPVIPSGIGADVGYPTSVVTDGAHASRAVQTAHMSPPASAPPPPVTPLYQVQTLLSTSSSSIGTSSLAGPSALTPSSSWRSETEISEVFPRVQATSSPSPPIQTLPSTSPPYSPPRHPTSPLPVAADPHANILMRLPSSGSMVHGDDGLSHQANISRVSDELDERTPDESMSEESGDARVPQVSDVRVSISRSINMKLTPVFHQQPPATMPIAPESSPCYASSSTATSDPASTRHPGASNSSSRVPVSSSRLRHVLRREPLPTTPPPSIPPTALPATSPFQLRPADASTTSRHSPGQRASSSAPNDIDDLFVSLVTKREVRPFRSGTANGQYTLWYTSTARFDLPYPPPNLLRLRSGYLYLHGNTLTGDMQVWLWQQDRTWSDVVWEGMPHPTIQDRYLWYRSKFEPSWVTRHTYVTYKGRQKRDEIERDVDDDEYDDIL